MSDFQIEADFSGLEKLLKELKSDYYTDIGILGKNSSTEDGLTLAGIGLVQEVGTFSAGPARNTTIPARSWLKMPLNKKAKDIQSAAEGKWQENAEEANIKAVFETIGIAGEAAIKEAFATSGFGEWAPNAESTIRKKGSDSPLIDEGTLRDAVTSKVGKG